MALTLGGVIALCFCGWWTIAVYVLTFHGPLLVTSNAYMARWLALLCTLAAAQQCPGADEDALTLSTKSRAELDQLRACVLGTTAIDRTVTRILLVGTDANLNDARVVKLDASLPVKQRAQFFAAARVVVEPSQLAVPAG